MLPGRPLQPTSAFHLIVLSALAISILAFGVSGTDSSPGNDQRTGPESSELVELVSNGSSIWPYTSKERSFERRTLGINLIVRGDVYDTRRYFLRHTEGDWSRRPHPAEPVNRSEDLLPSDEPGIIWRHAHGSTRYTYVDLVGQDGGTWIAESYQLYDGSYLGTRYHIRVYNTPDQSENWSAIQAHKEYWDWFRLRHTVTSITDAQRYVEADVIDDPAIDTVWQLYLDNADTSDGTGWATVVEFATIFLVAGLIQSLKGGPTIPGRIRAIIRILRSKRPLPRGLLVGTIIFIYLGVRITGIALEQGFPGISPRLIAGILYPILVIGLPFGTGYIARRIDMEAAFLLTIIALSTAFVVDYMCLNLTVIPLSLLLHRVTLVLSLGLVAAGSSYHAHGAPRGNELLQIGTGGWILGLLLPLVGIV